MNLFLFTKNNLDEVVFEHRNKQYGAYALRKSYDEHLLKAAASSFGLLLLFGTVMYVISLFPSSVVLVKLNNTIPFENVLIDKIKIVPDVELLPKLSVKNTDNMNYTIVKDQLVVEPLTTPPNPNLTLNHGGGEQQVSGLGGPGIVDGAGTLPIVTPPIETAVPYVTFATDMPSFNGGTDALASYIRHELVYPAQALEFGREGKVMVSFIVQTDGSITNIEVIRGFGFGSEDEAKRVIERMPKWIPGKQNGKIVAVKLILPLHFQLN